MKREEALWDARHDQYLDSIPDFTSQESLEAVVASDLAKPLAELFECEGAAVEAYESAVNKLRMAIYARLRDI